MRLSNNLIDLFLKTRVKVQNNQDPVFSESPGSRLILALSLKKAVVPQVTANI